MAIVNGYCTLAEARAWLGIGTSDTVDDAVIEAIAEEVSRWIDSYCSRRFYKNSSDETRYYTAINDYVTETDDIVSITTLKTDNDGDGVFESTWETDNYILWPYNGQEPYQRVEVNKGSMTYLFPRSKKGVQVVGVFGWSSVPTQIRRACVMQTARIFKRQDAIFGIAGSSAMGEMTISMPGLDSDVERLLNLYRRVY